MATIPSTEMKNKKYSLEFKEGVLSQYRLTLLKNETPVRVLTTYQKRALLQHIRDLKESPEPEETIMILQ